MAEIKTRPTGVAVDEFLDAVPDPQRRADGKALREMFERITGEPATMWGASIVGFGSYHYKYDSGHEGEMCRLGYSPRKAELVLYVLTQSEGQDALLARIGKHRTGKSCLYIKRLGDVDQGVLEELTVHALDYMRERYPEGA
ncbi:MAG: DUF1801 domain-containing protein [Sphingosinicella sp.]|uniref:DUF1801 domain-containing protein n=1 Tax=Sphingosinicella sp. TaxID=1917971 RepID=UPI004037877A